MTTSNVSTKPIICSMCQTECVRTSNRQKYCSDCKRAIENARCRTWYEKNKVLKGYNQARENNNSWKGGIQWSKKLAKEVGVCNRCGSTKNLLVHHKDADRYNNEADNIEVLCKRCHQQHHKCWKHLPKGERLSQLKKEQAAHAKRNNGTFCC